METELSYGGFIKLALGRYIGSLYWVVILGLYIGALYWVFILSLYIGSLYWVGLRE